MKCLYRQASTVSESAHRFMVCFNVGDEVIDSFSKIHYVPLKSNRLVKDSESMEKDGDWAPAAFSLLYPWVVASLFFLGGAVFDEVWVVLVLPEDTYTSLFVKKKSV